MLFMEPSLRGCTSRLPGAWSLDTLGVSGWVLYLALIPLADARLLAIEDERLRPGYLWCDRVGGGFTGGVCFVVGSSFGGPSLLEPSWLSPSFSSSSSSSSRSFSMLPWLGGPTGSFSSSDSRLWCSSNSLSVRSASMLLVLLDAFANSPAAWACSLMATVVSDVCVAIAAARA